jgi:hypothetical protein
MSTKQSGKPAKTSNPRKIALIGAFGTALGVINIMSNGAEAPSQGVMILQYGALGLGLLALVGGLIMMATAPK